MDREISTIKETILTSGLRSWTTQHRRVEGDRLGLDLPDGKAGGWLDLSSEIMLLFNVMYIRTLFLFSLWLFFFLYHHDKNCCWSSLYSSDCAERCPQWQHLPQNLCCPRPQLFLWCWCYCWWETLHQADQHWQWWQPHRACSFTNWCCQTIKNLLPKRNANLQLCLHLNL